MRYWRARLRAVVCAVTDSCSASPGSTSGASATSASLNFLIEYASLALAALMQRADAKIKTTAIFVLLVTRKWLTANHTNTTNLLLDQLAQRPPGTECKGSLKQSRRTLDALY